MISVDKGVSPGGAYPLIRWHSAGVKADVIVSMDVDEKLMKRPAGDLGKEQQLLALFAQNATSSASSQNATRDSTCGRFKCPDKSAVVKKINDHLLHPQITFYRNILTGGSAQTVSAPAAGKPTASSGNAPGCNTVNNRIFSPPLEQKKSHFSAPCITHSLQRSPENPTRHKEFESILKDHSHHLKPPQQHTQLIVSSSGGRHCAGRVDSVSHPPHTAGAPSARQLNAPAHSGGPKPPALPTQSFMSSKCFNKNSSSQGGIEVGCIDTATTKKRVISIVNDLNKHIQNNGSSRFVRTLEVGERASRRIVFLSSASFAHSPANQTTSFIHAVSDGDQMDTSECIDSGATSFLAGKKAASSGSVFGEVNTSLTSDQHKLYAPVFSSPCVAALSPAMSHAPAAQRSICMPNGSNNAPSGSPKSHQSHGFAHLPATVPSAPQTAKLPHSAKTPKFAPITTTSTHTVTLSASPVTSVCTPRATKPPSTPPLNGAALEPSDASSPLRSSESSSAPAEDTSRPVAGEHIGIHSGRQLRARNKSRKFLPEKTRHKRQTLQDMTRPLKQWLVKHRENPYPSKHEKIELVKTSHMSMTQVSNWFANARRRLKNTVRGENVSWARRIKDYNQFAEGNAERLNFSSSDEDGWDSGQETEMVNQDCSVQSEPAGGEFQPLPATTLTSSLSDTALTVLASPPPAQCQTSSPSPARSAPALEEHPCSRQKFKHSILQRYLQQAILPSEDVVTSSPRHRHLSSSTGSHDFEYLSTSSVSSPSHEAHQDSFDDCTEDMETIAIKLRPADTPNINNNDELYWKEISAALALTSLARSSHVTN